MTGAERLSAAMARHGITHVFGLPGTQSVALFDGLRRSSLRTILATHELNAAFMAAGFFRASGRPAGLVTIPGPGFTHAMSGIVEARHDSCAMLYVVGPPASRPGKQFRLQAIDQNGIGNAVAKGVFEATAPGTIERIVADAYSRAVEGEPGPVVLHVHPEALAASGSSSTGSESNASRATSPGLAQLLEPAGRLLANARRPVLLAGQGAVDAASELRMLAERLGAPVATSCSGRGVIAEDHALALGFDVIRSSTGVLNELLASSDCVVVVGYKLTHNGTAGFRLALAPHTLVHIDAGAEVLNANYPAAHAIVADARAALQHFVDTVGAASRSSTWTTADVANWRDRLSATPDDDTPEPSFNGASPPTAQRFFSLLRAALPREAIVVADSGLHQILLRRHYRVLSPRGLIAPSDYQSMGFGVPAAIGAKLGAPHRPVIAIVGDGGFAMTGMELLTAVREQIPVTVVVFNDGLLNLIRVQQEGASGRATAVTLQNPDFAALAAAIGAEYRLFSGPESLDGLGNANGGVRLIEVRLGDSAAIVKQQVAGAARYAVRRALGPGFVNSLKRWLGRA